MDNYHLSEEAANDLARIQRYYRRIGAEEVAVRLIDRLVDSLELLAKQPYMGVERPYLPGMRSHSVPNTRYVVLYFPDSRPIEIARVAHGRRDIEGPFEQLP
jgi:plasmid stabilization system protein ParE